MLGNFKLLVFLRSAVSLQVPVTQQQKVRALARTVASTGLGMAICVAPMANAGDKRSVGSITGSGFVFKDKLQVDAFPDKQVEGVTIYLSDFERPITDRLAGNFFSDPTQTGLGCARRSTPLKINGKLTTSPEGEEVVSEARSLLFKSINVRRIYDVQSNNLVYAAFSTRLNTGDDSNKARFASSLCVVPLDPPSETSSSS